VARLELERATDVENAFVVMTAQVAKRRPLVPGLRELRRPVDQTVEALQRLRQPTLRHGANAERHEPASLGILGVDPDPPDPPLDRFGLARPVGRLQTCEQIIEPRVVLVGEGERRRPYDHRQGHEHRAKRAPHRALASSDYTMLHTEVWGAQGGPPRERWFTAGCDRSRGRCLASAAPARYVPENGRRDAVCRS